MVNTTFHLSTFTSGDECVLCSIKIDSNGTMVVKPDFSSKPYIVQTGGFAKETYEFTIEHVSSKITTDELLREHRLHRELYLRHSEYVKNLVGSSFKMVSSFLHSSELCLKLWLTKLLSFSADRWRPQGARLWRDSVG